MRKTTVFLILCISLACCGAFAADEGGPGADAPSAPQLPAAENAPGAPPVDFAPGSAVPMGPRATLPTQFSGYLLETMAIVRNCAGVKDDPAKVKTIDECAGRLRLLRRNAPPVSRPPGLGGSPEERARMAAMIARERAKMEAQLREKRAADMPGMAPRVAGGELGAKTEPALDAMTEERARMAAVMAQRRARPMPPGFANVLARMDLAALREEADATAKTAEMMKSCEGIKGDELLASRLDRVVKEATAMAASAPEPGPASFMRRMRLRSLLGGTMATLRNASTVKGDAALARKLDADLDKMMTQRPGVEEGVITGEDLRERGIAPAPPSLAPPGAPAPAAAPPAGEP